MLLLVLLAVGGSLCVSVGQSKRHTTKTKIPVVKLCELVANPAKYEGKEIAVFATYRFGIETQILWCLSCTCDRCPAEAIVGVDEEQLPDAIRRRIPSGAGTVNGIFRGRFNSQGDTGRHEMIIRLTSIAKMVILYDGIPPETLDLTPRMCGGAKRKSSCP